MKQKPHKLAESVISKDVDMISDDKTECYHAVDQMKQKPHKFAERVISEYVDTISEKKKDTSTTVLRQCRKKGKTARYCAVDQMIVDKVGELKSDRKIFFCDTKGKCLDNASIKHTYVAIDEMIMAPDSRTKNLVFRGRMSSRKNKVPDTFICAKMSDSNSGSISSQEWAEIYESLLTAVDSKPDVVRGARREGVRQRYVCFGFRKDPKGTYVSEYSFKKKAEDKKQSINDDMQRIVEHMEAVMLSFAERSRELKCF